MSVPETACPPLLVCDLCCSPVLQAELQPLEAQVLAGALVLADPARLRLLSLILFQLWRTRRPACWPVGC